MSDWNNFAGQGSCRRPHAGTDRPSSGFTLLEVMIAVSILGISLTTLFGSQSQSVSLGARAMFNIQAPLLAQLKQTEFLRDPQNSTAGSSGDFGQDYPGYHWQLESEDVSLESETLGKAVSKLQRLTLTISREQDRFIVQSLERKELPN